MDANVAMSKVRTAIERRLKDDPKWSGVMRVRLRFKHGKVVELKKGLFSNGL